MGASGETEIKGDVFRNESLPQVGHFFKILRSNWARVIYFISKGERGQVEKKF